MTADQPAARWTAPAELLRMINGYQVSQALSVTAALGIADMLADGARPVAKLAHDAGADEAALYRLLRAVAAAGVLREDGERNFALTPLGEFLRSDHPASIAAWAMQIGQPYFWQAWGHLLHGIRTGENPFRAVNGSDVWTWRAERTDLNDLFNRSMTSLSQINIGPVVDAFDFARFAHIADIGGGHGAFLAAILRSAPAARGTLFDQPHVVAGAGPILERAGVAERCDIVAGDMFASVPAGADAYVMKSILHDWDDDACERILRVCRAAMVPAARVLVVEQIVAPPNEGMPTKFSDLNMFAVPGGLERTEAEFSALFERADMRLASVTRSDGLLCVLEVAPA